MKISAILEKPDICRMIINDIHEIGIVKGSHIRCINKFEDVKFSGEIEPEKMIEEYNKIEKLKDKNKIINNKYFQDSIFYKI